MSRGADISQIWGTIPAASAATANLYLPIVDDTNSGVSHKAFLFVGYFWGYNTVEANADNTLDFVITSDSALDGTFATTVHTNANAFGLLDSAAIGAYETDTGNAAIAAGAAVAVSPTQLRIPAGQTVRVALTTAGTGTVPAVTFGIYGYWV